MKALITYGWNRVSYNILRSLSRQNVKVIIGDSHKLAMSRFSKYASGFFQYKSFYADPKGFLSTIILNAEKYKTRIYFPVHEETFIAAKYKGMLEDAGLIVPLSNFKVLESLHKKEKLFDLCRQWGIPAPKIYKVSDLKNIDKLFEDALFPVVLKTNQTNSAKGVEYIFSKTTAEDEFVNFLQKFKKVPFLQDYVRGDGYGVSVLMNQGQVRAVFTHKRLREKTYTGGTSTVRVSVRNPRLEEYAVSLLSKLKFHGLAMVEFKYDEQTKKGYLIDVNPRFWGSLALAIYSGVDFPWLLFQMARDGDVAPVMNYKEGVRVKWVLGDVIALFSEAAHTKKALQSIKHFFGQKSDAYDDLVIDDLLPFMIECFYYFSKFVSSGNMNPVEESILDIDKI